jgi:hypothetical protein
MPSKLPSVVAAVSTFILLLIAGAGFFIVQIIALNGVMSETKAFSSLAVGVVCQGVGMLLAAVLAAWLSKRLIERFNWNKVLAVLIAVISAVVLGLILSLISTMVSIPIAGIR